MHTDASASDREQNFAKRVLLEAPAARSFARSLTAPGHAAVPSWQSRCPARSPGGCAARSAHRIRERGARMPERSDIEGGQVRVRRRLGSRRTDKVHDEGGRVTGGWEDGRGLCSVEEVARGGRGATDHGGGMRIGWVAAGVRACGWTRCEGRRVRTRAASRLLALNAIRGIHYGETGATSSAAGANEWGREKGLGRAQGRICYRARISVLARGG